MPIERAFSRGAEEYDAGAWIQKQAAEDLASYFQLGIPRGGALLEVGAGSGFLTEKILHSFPNHRFQAVDLSSKMKQIAKRKFPTIDYQTIDGETFFPPVRLAALFLGMSLQWFQNPRTYLAKISKQILKGGKIFFSFPNHRSFPEWDLFSLNAGISPEGLLRGFLYTLEERRYQESFPSRLHFLKSLKARGTHGAEKRGKHLSSLLRLRKELEPFQITYHITLGVIHV